MSIDQDLVQAQPAVTAVISGHTAVLRIDDDRQDHTAVNAAALREVLVGRVLLAAKAADRPVRMWVVDETGPTIVLVAPDGHVEQLGGDDHYDRDDSHEVTSALGRRIGGVDEPGAPGFGEDETGPGGGEDEAALARRRIDGLPATSPSVDNLKGVPEDVPEDDVDAGRRSWAREADRTTGGAEVSPLAAGEGLGAPAGRGPRHLGDRPSFITAGRSVQPANQGWRGGLNRSGLRLAPGPDEQSYREEVAAVSRHWPGTRTVAVVNPKGSAGKTPAVACLSAVFARRGGAGVLALDNNETNGTLRFRTEWSAHEASLLHLLPKVEHLLAPAAGVAELANYVHHQPADRYDVLWSDPTIDGEHVVSAADVEAVHRVASRYYRMVVMDSGNNDRAANWRAMIDRADVLVVPCTEVEDTAEVGARVLETLTHRGGHSAELARNAVVLVSQRSPKGKNMERILRDFAGLARTVIAVPYDPALETGVIRYDALRPATQRAWLRAAAALAEDL